MKAFLNSFSALNRFINNICIALACVLLFLMTAAVLLQVISRELRTPIGWTEETALAAMVWVAFLIAPWAYHRHMFTRIDVLLVACSAKIQSWIHLLIHLAEGAILIAAMPYLFSFFERGTDLLPGISNLARTVIFFFTGTDESEFTVTNQMNYIIMPASVMLMILVNAEHVFRQIYSIYSGVDHRISDDLGEVLTETGEGI